MYSKRFDFHETSPSGIKSSTDSEPHKGYIMYREIYVAPEVLILESELHCVLALSSGGFEIPDVGNTDI